MKVVLLIVLTMVTSCAGPAPKFSRIAIGMSKAEVINQLGKPASFSAVDNTERLTYGRWDNSAFDGRIGGGRYFVKLVDNKVTAFGKYGDPDGSPRPTILHLPPTPPIIDVPTSSAFVVPTPAPIPFPFQNTPAVVPPPSPVWQSKPSNPTFTSPRVFDVQPGVIPNSIEVRER